MRKIAVVLLLFIGIAGSAVSLQTQGFTLTIWVNKGCGGDYFVGDMLTVNWRVSHNCEIIFWEIEPDGFKRRLHSGPIIAGAGEGSRGWTLKDYGYGKRAIYAEATSIWGSASDQCDYYVHRKAADIQVTVVDQDGAPISEATVVLDGAVIAATTSAGVATLTEVDFGDHLITVRVGDEEQSSQIQITSLEKHYLDFTFTVEKKGSIQISVFDQTGSPISHANISVDGAREGTTDEQGMIMVSVEEGSHFIEIKCDGETVERSVTVQRGKITPVEVTMYIMVETTIDVLVLDDEGAPVSDAGVYTDNVFLGRTDGGGHVQQLSTVGFHTLRVEKQGYTPYIQDIMLQEGENELTVTIVPEKETPLYGILSLIGMIYLLKRKRTP